MSEFPALVTGNICYSGEYICKASYREHQLLWGVHLRGQLHSYSKVVHTRTSAVRGQLQGASRTQNLKNSQQKKETETKN